MDYAANSTDLGAARQIKRINAPFMLQRQVNETRLDLLLTHKSEKELCVCHFNLDAGQPGQLVCVQVNSPQRPDQMAWGSSVDIWPAFCPGAIGPIHQQGSWFNTITSLDDWDAFPEM
jgi:hypothetical protein